VARPRQMALTERNLGGVRATVWPVVRRFGMRALHGLFLLVGVSILTFALVDLAPGDFTDDMRLDPRIDSATLAALRARYALDVPLAERYLAWVQSALRGEFGYSFAYNVPVSHLLWHRGFNTLLITVTATALAWLVAVPLGVRSAVRRGGFFDRTVTATTATLQAMPDLLLGLGALWLALWSGVLPVGGLRSLGTEAAGVGPRLLDLATHLLLPVSALVLAILPMLVRHVRASLIDVLQAPFIQAARARGVPEGRLVYRSALRVAANPLTVLAGYSIASLLSASLVVEVIMSWPGLGPLLLDATLARDVHVIAGTTTAATVLLIAGMFTADGLLYLADPRVRGE
jgi:peptide/nickel transport system permease protein